MNDAQTKNIQLHLDRALKAVDDITLCEHALDHLFFLKQSVSIMPPPVDFFPSESNTNPDIPKPLPDNFAEIIGAAIKSKRESLGLTQNELSELVGIKRPNIARLEKGSTLPNISTLIKLSRGLSISLLDILKY
jgi:DNA-binding XRE family transcriptional regulator